MSVTKLALQESKQKQNVTDGESKSKEAGVNTQDSVNDRNSAKNLDSESNPSQIMLGMGKNNQMQGLM